VAGAADEEVAVADEAALEEEAAIAEEEAAAAEQAALEEEFAGEEPVDPDLVEPFAEPDLGIGEEPDPWTSTPSPPPPGWREQQMQQQMQRAQARLADRQAAHTATRAELEAATAAHDQAATELAAAEREVEGFRIGIASEIAAAGEEADAAEAITPFAPRAVVGPEPVIPDAAAPAPAPRDTVVPSDKPAPVGYEAFEYNGETYFRHALREDAPYYTQSQLGAISRDDPLIGDEQILLGPNEQFPGFDAVLRDGKASYMPKETADGVYHVYTRDQVVSGEAAADEKFLAEYAARAAKKPTLMARIRGLFGPS
jgi:hypothetical protein